MLLKTAAYHPAKEEPKPLKVLQQGNLGVFLPLAIQQNDQHAPCKTEEDRHEMP